MVALLVLHQDSKPRAAYAILDEIDMDRTMKGCRSLKRPSKLFME